MSDDALRALERRFRATGDVVDHAEWLAARLRAGEVPAARVALAAALGHPAARRILPDSPELPVCRFDEQLAAFLDDERAAFAAAEAGGILGADADAPAVGRPFALHDLLERALHVLAREVAARCPPDDPHVGVLGGALAEWARCPCGTHRWTVRSAREGLRDLTRAQTFELLLAGGVAEAEAQALVAAIDQRVIASAQELAAALEALVEDADEDDDGDPHDAPPPLPQPDDDWELDPWAAALGDGWVPPRPGWAPELGAALRRVEGGRRLLAALGLAAVVGRLNRGTSDARELRPVFGCAFDAAAALVGDAALREALLAALGPVVLDEGV